MRRDAVSVQSAGAGGRRDIPAIPDEQGAHLGRSHCATDWRIVLPPASPGSAVEEGSDLRGHARSSLCV